MKRTRDQSSSWADGVLPIPYGGNTLKQLIIDGFLLRPGIDYIDVDQSDLRPPSPQPHEWKEDPEDDKEDDPNGVFYGVDQRVVKGEIRDFVDNFSRICPAWRREAENLREDKHFAFLLTYNAEPFLFNKLWWNGQPLPPVPWEEITDEQRTWYPA
jgi:hypothetical protein